MKKEAAVRLPPFVLFYNLNVLHQHWLSAFGFIQTE